MYYGRWQDVLNQINTENALAEQQRQFDAEMASRAAQLAEEQRQFNASVSGGSGGITGGSGGSSNYGSLVKSSSSNVGNYNLYSNGLSTPYYQGAYNADREKYGTFSNGYQPKGITGHGKLKDSGNDVQITTQVKYGSSAGKKLTLTQTVWKADDGTLWVWDGTKNKYVSYGKEGGGGKSFGGGTF